MNYKKINVCLDTNVLMYLAENNYYDEDTFDKFLKGVLNNYFNLVLPKIVLKEWKSNLNRIHKGKKEEIASLEKGLKYISQFLNKNKDNLVIESYEKVILMQKRILKYDNNLQSEKINNIINDKYLVNVIDRDYLSDKLLVDFALDKKSPFFTERNNNQGQNKMESADASIFFSYYSYLKNNGSECDNYFITENKKDFSDPNNPSIIHGNLQKMAMEVNMIFSNNLKEIMKKIVPTVIVKYQDDKGNIIGETEEGRLFEKANHSFLEDKYFVKCSSCSSEVHINADSSIRMASKGPYPETIWLTCSECGNEWDTREWPFSHMY